MAVIDGVFCLDARVINDSETLSDVTLDWSETIRIYNTPDTTVKDRSTKWVMKYVYDLVVFIQLILCNIKLQQLKFYNFVYKHRTSTKMP